jgi:hypothetical protein
MTVSGTHRRFTVEWLCLTELPFSRVRNVPVKPQTPLFLAFRCFDGTEIAASSAFSLLQAFSTVEREVEADSVAQQVLVGAHSPMEMDTVVLPSSATPSVEA